HVVVQCRPVIEVHAVGGGVNMVDPGLVEENTGPKLPSPRADDPSHAGQSERDEQQRGLVHMVVVPVHHHDLGFLRPIPPPQPVGGQRSAGAPTEDHDSLHMIILRLGSWLAAGAFVLRPGDHRRGQARPRPDSLGQRMPLSGMTARRLPMDQMLAAGLPHVTTVGGTAPPLAGRARVYACGITPYDGTHLEHAATFVWVDTLARVLHASGAEVIM